MNVFKRARVLVLLVGLLGAGCDATDVVAYRALAGCVGPSCTPGQDAQIPDDDARVPDDDARVPDDDASIDAGPDGGGGTCAAATCQNALRCDAPIARAIVGDSCGDQPWVAPGFRNALCVCGDYVSEFPLTVVRDPRSVEQGAASVSVDGDLTAGARLEIAGSLTVSGALALVDQASLDADDVQSDTAQPRCDCSAQVALTSEAVLALASSNPAGFDSERFGSVETDETIALSCGAYRIPRIAGPSGLNLTISGHVVLVVEGDVAIDANLEATLAEGALLELFVLGNLRVTGALLLGDEDDDVRVYVLGSGTIDLGAEAFIAGPLYAPNAELVTRADLTTMGSILARRAAPGGAVVIRYDSATAHATSCDGQ